MGAAILLSVNQSLSLFPLRHPRPSERPCSVGDRHGEGLRGDDTPQPTAIADERGGDGEHGSSISVIASIRSVDSRKPRGGSGPARGAAKDRQRAPQGGSVKRLIATAATSRARESHGVCWFGGAWGRHAACSAGTGTTRPREQAPASLRLRGGREGGGGELRLAESEVALKAGMNKGLAGAGQVEVRLDRVLGRPRATPLRDSWSISPERAELSRRCRRRGSGGKRGSR